MANKLLIRALKGADKLFLYNKHKKFSRMFQNFILIILKLRISQVTVDVSVMKIYKMHQ